MRTSGPALSARCELSTPRLCATASIAVIFADTAAAQKEDDLHNIIGQSYIAVVSTMDKLTKKTPKQNVVN